MKTWDCNCTASWARFYHFLSNATKNKAKPHSTFITYKTTMPSSTEHVKVIDTCCCCHTAYDGVCYVNGRVISKGFKKNIKNTIKHALWKVTIRIQTKMQKMLLPHCQTRLLGRRGSNFVIMLTIILFDFNLQAATLYVLCSRMYHCVTVPSRSMPVQQATVMLINNNGLLVHNHCFILISWETYSI